MAFTPIKKDEEITEGAAPSMLPPRKNKLSIVTKNNDLDNKNPQIRSKNENVNLLVDKIKDEVARRVGKEFEIIIDVFVVEKIITSIIYNPRQKSYNLFNDRGDFIVATEQQLIDTKMTAFFGEPVRNMLEFFSVAEDVAMNAQGSVVQSVLKSIVFIPILTLVDYLTSYMQCGENRLVVDMFAKKSEIRLLRDGVSQITYKHEPYKPTRSLYNDDLLNDYKEHFPKLDDLLSAIVASRFAADRKKSFLWMQCESDWGKGFFINRLSKIGAMYEMTVDEARAASTGKPMGMRPSAIKRALVICFNEFNHIDKSLKTLENNIKLSPKHEMECTMEIYFKLFLSAQHIPSLAGDYGVESEFSNRFSYYKAAGNIDKRQLFKQFNSDYEAVVETYICDKLNSLIDYYVSLGPIKAESVARENQYKFYNENAIKNQFTVIEEELDSIVEDIRTWILDNSVSSMKMYKNLAVETKTIQEYQSIFVTSIKTVIDEYIKNCVDHSDKSAIGKRKTEIIEKLCVRGSLKTNKVNKKTLRGIWIS